MTDRHADACARISWLGRNLDPGDEFVVVAYGQAGPVARWERPLTLVLRIAFAGFGALLVIGMTRKHMSLPGGLWFLATPAFLTTALAGRPKPACLAVSRHYLYVVHLPQSSRSPLRVLIRTPSGCVRATALSGYPRQTVVRLEGADFPLLKGLTFSADRDGQDDLDAALAALHATGARIVPLSSGVRQAVAG